MARMMILRGKTDLIKGLKHMTMERIGQVMIQVADPLLCLDQTSHPSQPL